MAQVYELGMGVASRFASLVPGGGQPFVGHNNAPKVGKGGGYLSVLDLHGTKDKTCKLQDRRAPTPPHCRAVFLAKGLLHR